jgi:hypothetical protein
MNSGINTPKKGLLAVETTTIVWSASARVPEEELGNRSKFMMQ